MALSRTNLTSGNSTADEATTASFTPPDNSVLVVCVGNMTDDTSGDTSAEITAAGGGLTYVPEINEGKTLATAFSANGRIFTAQVATGASMTVTFDTTGARSMVRWAWSIFAYTGAHASDPGGVTGTLEAGPADGAVSFNLAGAPAAGSEMVGLLLVDTGQGVTPGSGWTEVHDINALGDIGIQTQVRAASPVAPAFGTAGAGAIIEASGGALSPASPAVVNDNDLLVIFAYYEGVATTPSTPPGFSILDGPRVLASNVGRCWVFGKQADGTEDGAANALGTPAVTTMRAARCYRFTGVRDDTVTNIVGGFAFDGPASSATVNDVGVTTPETNCLAVNLLTIADDNAVGNFAGETGGDWTEAIAEFTSAATTPDYCQQLQTAFLAAAGTINGGSLTMAAADPFGVVGFYIRGGSTNDPAVAWVDVDTGGTAATSLAVAVEIKEAAAGAPTAPPASRRPFIERGLALRPI